MSEKKIDLKRVIDTLSGHSLAMYSTWVYHKPTRVLFDAGEGVSLAMRNSIFGVDKVFLSHGHHDHFGGLAGMLFARASAMGDKEKPLTIYYPPGWNNIYAFQQYQHEMMKNLKYELKWRATNPGDVIKLENGLSVVAFEVSHAFDGLCLGYRIVEKRHRLKKELEGQPSEVIKTIVQAEGRDAVREWYEHKKFVYCGDSAAINPVLAEGADVLVHEATFLDVEDRDRNVHASAEEALEVAKTANVGALILIHISGRYPRREVEGLVKAAARKVGWDKPLAVLIGRRFVEL